VHAGTIIAKRLCLPAHASWRDDFAKEFVEFPNGKFTDQVDATTQFLDHADEFAGLEPTPQAGLASLDLNSRGQKMTISRSSGGEPGRVAGTHSDGRPFTGLQSKAPFPSIKVKVRY
jgi:hypothetical protein